MQSLPGHNNAIARADLQLYTTCECFPLPLPSAPDTSPLPGPSLLLSLKGWGMCGIKGVGLRCELPFLNQSPNTKYLFVGVGVFDGWG
jgi:hypothetical protein